MSKRAFLGRKRFKQNKTNNLTKFLPGSQI